MNPGRYRHTIQFQRLDEDTEEWTGFFTCRAYVNGMSGKEYFAAGSDRERLTVTFETRHCNALACLSEPDASSRYRIQFEGRTYDIQYADNFQYSNRAWKIRTALR